VEVVGQSWRFPLKAQAPQGEYTPFVGQILLETPGLYFYHFHIWDAQGDFDLFSQGADTNMQIGEPWQLSVVPENFQVPEAFRGAVYYQIFPDRFYKAGVCDVREKLLPYTLCPFETFVPQAPDASDFAGGNLRGIEEKLPYLQSLGVEVLYLNPIFMAASNHRYDTADYTKIDPLLGTEEDFVSLCRAAHERDMKIVLDGVFSHTGKNSVYFDSGNHFGGGAVSKGVGSNYYKWYDFQEFPTKYTSWWGIESLPCVNELEPSYQEFILGDQGVVAQWLRRGADGFRLDVADELPDEFIQALRRRVKAIKPQAVVIGEVWEDASNKISYGVQRQYFTCGELDGVINYPLRESILHFAAGKIPGTELAHRVMTLADHYPAGALDCTMAVLGTHDTERVGTALPELSQRRVAAFLQFTLPGAPVIYYGDEAGLLGGRDPMCRLPFPWGREDKDLQALYAQLAHWKKAIQPLRRGDIRFLPSEDDEVRFVRTWQNESVECCANRVSGEFWLRTFTNGSQSVIMKTIQ
jgi:glycosidase